MLAFPQRVFVIPRISPNTLYSPGKACAALGLRPAIPRNSCGKGETQAKLEGPSAPKPFGDTKTCTKTGETPGARLFVSAITPEMYVDSGLRPRFPRGFSQGGVVFYRKPSLNIYSPNSFRMYWASFSVSSSRLCFPKRSSMNLS